MNAWRPKSHSAAPAAEDEIDDMPWKYRVALLLAACCYLYLQTFILPCVPISQGDNTHFFLLDGARMLRGEVLYRDFQELTFPGMEALTFLLLKSFGMRAWIPAATLICVGALLTLLGVMITSKVLSGPSVFLPAVAYLTLAFGNALDDTHHWFSILACLAAVAVLLDNSRPTRVAWAGGLCGIACCFTQSRGALAMLALTAFFAWESHARKLGPRCWIVRVAILGAAYAAAALAFNTYFICKAGWSNFYYCTFTFLARYYGAFHRNNLSVYMVDLPDFAQVLLSIPSLGVWLFIHLVAPLVNLLFLVRWWRMRQEISPTLSRRLMLINMMGLAFFLSIASAPQWFRVASATLPALILLVWILNAPGRLHQFARQALWVFSLATGIGAAVITQSSAMGPLETPTGRVEVLSSDRYEKYHWLIPRVQAGQYILDAGNGEAYFFLELQDPAPVSFLTDSSFTRPGQVDALLNKMAQTRVEYIIWPVELDQPPPGNRGSDALRPLRAYMRKQYRVVKVFTNGDQVWQKHDGADQP